MMGRKTSVVKEVEELEPLYIAGENENGAATVENFEGSLQFKHKTHILLLGIYPKELKTERA